MSRLIKEGLREYKIINKSNLPFWLVIFISFLASFEPSIDFILSILLIPLIICILIWCVAMLSISYEFLKKRMWRVSVYYVMAALIIWPFIQLMLFEGGGAIIHLSILYPYYLINGAAWFHKNQHVEFDWGAAGGGIVANKKYVLVYDSTNKPLTEIGIEGSKLYYNSDLQKVYLMGNFYLFYYTP